MTMYPKITLVTPNFNLGAYLEKTIQSVINQGYPNLEYVIVDGGSTDDSLSVIEKYRDSLSKIIVEKDKGHADALNKGFRGTTGSIMGWINSDDILLPGSLFLLADTFSRFPHVHWAQGNQTLLNENGMIVKSLESRPISQLRCLAGDYRWIQQESTFWSRELWNTCGGYIDDNIKLAVDFELWLRFFRHTVLYPLQGGVGAFRLRKGQRSESQFDEYEREVLSLINRDLAIARPDWKNKYTDVLPIKARTLSPEDRVHMPGLKKEDLLALRYDQEKGQHIDPNPSATRKGIRKPIQQAGSPPPATFESFRDQHRGGRIFLMGNGPSLNKMDLELLKNDVVFGCNSCFLLFDRISWRPRYYTCVDTRVLPDRAQEISQMHREWPEMAMFFPEILRVYDGTGRRTQTSELIAPDRNIHFFKDYAPVREHLPYSAFSLDAVKGLAIPNTVTITMMQLAYFMGFEEIYLIGCDTSYTVPKSVVQDGPGVNEQEKLFLTSTEDDDPNHFDPSYFGKGRAWHNPKVEDMIEHYEHSKYILDQLDIKVFNATVGGNLEVFPRVAYDSLFK